MTAFISDGLGSIIIILLMVELFWKIVVWMRAYKQCSIELKQILHYDLGNILCLKMEDVVAEFYKEQNVTSCENSGYDLFVPEDVVFNPGETKFVDHKIQCEMLDSKGENVGYYLYPRSSISKTPLILCNSVGIIDAGYRGNIIAALKYIPDGNDTFILKKGTRIAQICAANLKPFDVVFQDVLSESKRGSGGFGSTGK